jgi:hypothetical protein
VTFTHDIEVAPGEIRRAWAQIQEGGMPFTDRQKGSATVYRMADYRSADLNHWIGASGPEIQHRLEHGYDVDLKPLDIGGEAEYAMPQIELDDEVGDLLVDQVLGGEDFYRVQWQESEAPRSLTIRACIGMHAGVEAHVLGAYMEWILKVIDAAQRRGIVPTVELWVGTQRSFSRRPNESMRVRIPLVDAGEMVDVTSWRAYLTPGAFRSLGFVAIALGADKARRTLTFGMGAPTNKQWAVRFEDNVLDIECPGGANSFPEEEMDRMLEAAYAA